MIRYLFFLTLTICASAATAQGVLIGGNSPAQPDTSALLEIRAQNQGFLPPRLTKAQRDSIVQPAVGLMIYNLESNCLNFYTGVYWSEVCGSCQPQPSPALVGQPSSPAISQWDTVFQADFNNNQVPPNLSMAGTATVTGGLLQLTPNQSNTTGRVVLQHSSPSASSENYEVYFDMYHGGGSGADGHTVIFGDSLQMVNVLNNTSASQVLAVDFCSYNNSSYCNRISVSYNNVQLAFSQPFSWRNTTVPVKIELNSTGLTGVWINNSLVLGPTVLPSAWANTNKTDWKWGFTGYCGGLNDFHRLDNILIRCATRYTLNLAATNPNIGTGSWAIISGQNGQILNPNQTNSSFAGQMGEPYSLEWQVSNICGTASDSLTISH
jgi:hypothetical protein